jgi:hypothetical protein
MGMGAQSQRGASSMRPQPQMPQRPQMPQIPRERAPQGIMALMQQRGKGAGMQGGMPQPAQQSGGMMPPVMDVPGGAQFSAMNFTPRPATMGLDGRPISNAPPNQSMMDQMSQYRQRDQGGMQQTQMPPGMGPQQFLAQQQGPSGGPGQINPQMLAAMQAFQQQGGRGQMPPAGMDQRMAAMQAAQQMGAPGKGAGMPPPRTQEEMQRGMDKMRVASDMRNNIDPRTGAPVGALVSQPAPRKGGGVPMTMPPTGMPQMSGGIASIDPRMMRGFPGF